MAYIVLARKYRPKTFEEVVGQGHVTRTLKNALKQGKIGHAYLFAGPRGVGKTSVARILAKALNCENGITPEPCNKCERCREITEARSVDVLEIDGASNRRIEEIRNLREGVGYAPANSRYKVYIIDEVHMLTNEAFNALLKTLEEPPPHVVFIFATTEPHRVPATIMSRCQRFDFRKLTTGEILKRLKEIKEKEGIKITDEALNLIAYRADGALRDAEVAIEQLTAYTEDEISLQDIKEVFGFIDRSFYIELIKGVIEQDDRKIISEIENIFEQGFDLKEFVVGLIDFLRELLLSRLDVKNPFSIEEDPEIKRMAGSTDEDNLVAMLNLAVELERSLRYISYSRAMVELYLLKMARIPYIKRVSELLSGVEKGAASVEAKKGEPEPPPRIEEEPLTGEKLWEKIKEEILKKASGGLRTLVNSVVFENFDKNERRLLLSNPRKTAHTDEQIFQIEDVAKDILGYEIEVLITTPTQGPQKEEKAGKGLIGHPLVNKAIKLFGVEDIY